MDELDLTCSNQKLAQHLAKIASYYIVNRDRYRARTFSEASKLIADYPFILTSGAHARQTIPRVGPSTMQIIDEYFETGTSSRLTELEEVHKERKDSVDEFMSVYGIGPAVANRYFDLGFRSLNDLWYGVPLSLAEEFELTEENVVDTAIDLGMIKEDEKFEMTNLFYNVLCELAIRSGYKYPKLTEAQRLGIQYREDLQIKIPRKEMDQIHERLEEILTDVKWLIAGSYRRGEDESGDIDILVKGADLSKVVDRLFDEGLIIGEMARGACKFMGILQLSPDTPARRVDILTVSKYSWAFATLYFTGSQRFNILSRQRAMDLGLRLNEHGLTDSKGTTYHAETEEEIFKILNLDYLEPEERSRNIAFI